MSCAREGGGILFGLDNLQRKENGVVVNRKGKPVFASIPHLPLPPLPLLLALPLLLFLFQSEKIEGDSNLRVAW